MVGSLVGVLPIGDGFGLAEWVVLNTVTVGMAVGRVGDGPRSVPPWAAVVGAVVGLVWLYWAAGGTLGIAHPARRNTDWYVLAAVWGFWALSGSAGIWTVARARPAGLPRWLPLTFGWVGTGSLFAWSAWKLPLMLYVAPADPADVTPPENLTVAVVLHLCAVVAGAAMMRIPVRSRIHAAESHALREVATRSEG
ncbi:hypothetical protein [Streptomyces sp. NPDC089799]|uniref:hypothetical protein n=1 Tax=Streptomyces sp. NPDC089799 TaxID=3155066 RepID=UPI0034183E22